ncbi:MAG: hypothetical protein Phyf2KO_20320 [Phycisphaerales bacterium]
MVVEKLSGLSLLDARLPLSEGERFGSQLWAAIDIINARYGEDFVYITTVRGRMW